MSWKGFQKGVSRASQSVKQNFSIGELSEDPLYEDAERRFRHLEGETKKLHTESKRFFDSIDEMLNHQLMFAQGSEELYKPISGRLSDAESTKPEGNPDGIIACERYRQIVTELQQSLRPELEMIDTRVIQPANELMEIIKAVRKTTDKRNRKKLDYDRHRASLKKITDKKEKTLKDEKAAFTAEKNVELATEEYEFYNNLLTDELPKLFKLERELIKPLFESFYYIQLNVFYTMHEGMQQMRTINYFDLVTDIEAGFKARQTDAQQQAESLGIVHFKAVGGIRKGSAAKAKAAGATAGPSSRPSDIVENPPPPYSQQAGNGTHTIGAGRPAWSEAAAKKKKPAPPPSKKPKPQHLTHPSVPPPVAPRMSAPARPAVPTVTALYDFVGQTDGDLSFTAGDVIEVTEKTESENGWWKGRLNGKTGSFPGNYVSMNG